MTSTAHGGGCILASMRSANGKGLVRTRAPYDLGIEPVLTVNGNQTVLVLEKRGMPVDQLAA